MQKKLILILAASSLLLQSCANCKHHSKSQLIEAHGFAQVIARPDTATFSFTIRQEDKEIANAQQQMAEKSQKTIVSLKEKGIAENDIKTTSYNTYPKYEYIKEVCDKKSCIPAKQVLSGYEAVESFSITVRDLKKANEILNSVTQSGVTEIGNLTFFIDDLTKARADAKIKAIANAKDDAQLVSESLGIKLDKIVAFRENNHSSHFIDLPFFKSSMARLASAENVASTSPSVESGEQKVSSQVTITYRIKEEDKK